VDCLCRIGGRNFEGPRRPPWWSRNVEIKKTQYHPNGYGYLKPHPYGDSGTSAMVGQLDLGRSLPKGKRGVRRLGSGTSGNSFVRDLMALKISLPDCETTQQSRARDEQSVIGDSVVPRGWAMRSTKFKRYTPGMDEITGCEPRVHIAGAVVRRFWAPRMFPDHHILGAGGKGSPRVRCFAD